MKERPIIFQGPKVTRILEWDFDTDGDMQTRRVVKPQPKCDVPGAYFDAYNGGPSWNWWAEDGRVCNSDTIARCPYGKPGDRLWVRETHALDVPGCEEQNGVSYRADHDDPLGDGPENPMKWRPSIHMPRLASRITLEVTEVRVERVQEISEQDAKLDCGKDRCCWEEGHDARVAFRGLWDSINKKRGYGWEENPWVWVVPFKRIEA